MNLRPLRLILLVTCLTLGACVSAERIAPATAGMSAQISDRLYFGRNIPTGGTVSDRAWAAFLAEVVTPRFPAGLTVLSGDGQWRGADGAIAHEKSFVLELLHPDDTASEQAVREIAAEYQRRFAQEAVLRVRDRVEVSF